LLRPIEFLDSAGRMIFTRADEFHAPYFENYQHLLGEEPRREFSFISQHQIIHTGTLRELLGRIESRFPGPENWAWKIMRHLTGNGCNLFSEYETYGHYVKNHHPDRAVFRDLPWTREGTRLASYHPRQRDLDELARNYCFAAFEAYQRPWRVAARRLKRWLLRSGPAQVPVQTCW
jgi:hypothetical protein